MVHFSALVRFPKSKIVLAKVLTHLQLQTDPGICNVFILNYACIVYTTLFENPLLLFQLYFMEVC